MKKQLFLALIAVCALFVGCTKDETTTTQPPVGYEEGDIIFGVSASIPETRTVYGDVNTEKNSIEINWDESDYVMIACAESAGAKVATYKVEDFDDKVGTDNKYGGAHEATSLVKIGDKGLQWGEGAHYFYAIYPSPDTPKITAGVESKMDADGLTGFLPLNQTVIPTQNGDGNYIQAPNMDYAYMVAKNEGVKNEEGVYEGVVGPTPVGLEFNSLVTAIQLELVGGDIKITGANESDVVAKDIEVQSVQLSAKKNSTRLCGGFNYKFKDDTATPATDNASYSTITMDYSSSPIKLKGGQTLDVTFFLLPTANYPDIEDFDTAEDYLKVTVIYTLNGTLMTKTAKIKSAIEPRHKHKFTKIVLPSHSGSTTEIEGTSWTTLIDDNVLLSQLSIPIAGNAFTYYYSGTNEHFYKTQDYDYEQLWAMGVRGFEFRTMYEYDTSGYSWNPTYTVKTIEGAKFICSGPVDNADKNLTFGSAFKTLYDKINDGGDYNDEFIILLCTYQTYNETPGFNPSYYLESLELFLKAYQSKLTLVTANTTIGDIRGKIAVIVRPGDDDYSSTQALTPTLPITIVKDWGTGIDQWDNRFRGYRCEGAFGNSTDNTIEDTMWGLYTDATTTNVWTNPSDNSTPYKINHPTASSTNRNYGHATISYDDTEATTVTSDAWIQCWERVIPQTYANNVYNAGTYSNSNVTMDTAYFNYQWFESLSEKKAMITETFDAAMKTGTGDQVANLVINSLGGFLPHDDMPESYYPYQDNYGEEIAVGTYDSWLGTRTAHIGPFNDHGFSSQGKGGDWKACSAALNKYAYDQIVAYDTANKQGPFGLVMINHINSTFVDSEVTNSGVTATEATEASSKLVNAIMMNNFKFQLKTKDETTEDGGGSGTEGGGDSGTEGGDQGGSGTEGGDEV